jgi:hypothetical protein
MKKLLFILCVTLITGNTFAQKIGIDKKKGTMSIDKVDVARFQSSKNAEKQDVYTYTDLNSDASVTLIMIKGDDPDNYFLDVTSTLSDKTSEMGYELVNFTLSMNSAISNLIVKKYNFFNSSGMDKEAIIAFLDKEDKSRRQAVADKAAAAKAMQDKIDVFSPTFKNNVTVVNKNTGELLAQFESKNGGLIIKDHLGNSFAAIRKNSVKESNTVVNTYVMETFMRQSYALDAKSENDAKTEAINKLILNDYFGDGKNSYILRKDEYEQAQEADKKRREEYEERSVVNGILTLEDGNTVEGKFKIDFREMADGTEAPTEAGTIVSLDGKTATHYYKDEKGKDKIKIYKEKQIRSFKVLKEDEPDYNEFYTKLAYIQEPLPQKKADIMDSDGSVNLLGVGKNLLGGKPKDKTKTDIIYVGPDNTKTSLYFSGSNIFITNKNTKKTIILNKENFESQLKDIAVNCVSVIENIENHSYEYSRKSILNFTEDLDNCK